MLNTTSMKQQIPFWLPDIFSSTFPPLVDVVHFLTFHYYERLMTFISIDAIFEKIKDTRYFENLYSKRIQVISEIELCMIIE